MQAIQASIELKIKMLATRLREAEAQNEILMAENMRLKSSASKTTTQFNADEHEQSAEFEIQLANARKVKRELELYLREMERKIERIKF